MKTRKRLLAGFLSLAMCLSLLPGTAFASNTWSDWTLGTTGDTFPSIDSLKVGTHTFTRAEGTNYIVVDGDTSGVTKAQVEEALADLTNLSVMDGVGILHHNELSEAQKTAATTGLYVSEDFYAKDIGATDDAYVNDLITNHSSDLSGAECVEKLFCIAWNNADPDMYAKTENWYYSALPYAGHCAIFYKEGSSFEITDYRIDKVMLYQNITSSGEAYIYTTAPENTGLICSEVSDATGTYEKNTQGLSFEIGKADANGTATMTISTNDKVSDGTYYIKVSSEDKSISKVVSFEVIPTYAVNLSVSPSAVGEQWTLYAGRTGIDDTSNVAYLPESTQDQSGSWYTYLVQLPLKDSNGNEYKLYEHPTDGETYDGKTYLLDHFEVKDSDGNEDKTVLKVNGDIIHQGEIARDSRGSTSFLMPARDISITAVFTEAYELDLGELKQYDTYNNYFEWYREGDEISISDLITTATTAAAESGTEIQQVTVYKTGDTSTVVATKTKDDGFTNFTFEMPAYAVSIDVVYATDVTAKLESVGEQADVLVAGRSGTTTIEVTTKNVADGTQLTITPCGITGTATTPTGLSLSISTVQSNKATITVTTTTEIAEDTYYFKLSTSDGTVLEYSKAYHGSITIGAAATKNLSVGTQQGSLAAGTAGSATYAGTATNLSDGETLTVTETDANGTPKTVNQTAGLTISASSVTSEQFTVTVSTTAAVQAGTYYFVVSQGDSLKSGVVTVTVEAQAGGTKYLVNSATYRNGYVSISTQSAAEGETITLTAQPNTGYKLATISVTKADGSTVTLSGTDNTRTFTMPASNVTVNATFASSVTTYPVKVSTVPNGTITVSPTEAAEGATVTVTVTPSSGYQMVAGSLKYSEASAGGAVVTISGNTFTMPGIEVSVSCQFEAVTTATESPVSITSFMINGVSAAINNESRVITIVLPYGTDLSTVAPVISGNNIKSISPASAQKVNLSSPKTYKVYGTDGTTVTYTVAAYTEDPTPAVQLWERLQEHINSTGNWWELAEYQKVTGYYGNTTSSRNLSSLQTYINDITAQYGTKRTTLTYYSSGGRLMLEPDSYSLSGTSYSNTLEFPRKTLSNLSDLGYSIVTYNLRELQIDIYEKMETTKGLELTVMAPSSSIRSAWNKLSGSGRIFEIEASSTKAGLVLRIPVGDVLKSELSLMKYDITKAKFVEVDRDTWYIQDGYLITSSVSAGVYGLRDQ